jgi:hypothetical protein
MATHPAPSQPNHTVDDILKALNIIQQASAASAQLAPGFSMQDHSTAVANTIAVGGAIAAANETDPQAQQKTQAITSLATGLAPTIFAIVELFRKKKN